MSYPKFYAHENKHLVRLDSETEGRSLIFYGGGTPSGLAPCNYTESEIHEFGGYKEITEEQANELVSKEQPFCATA